MKRFISALALFGLLAWVGIASASYLGDFLRAGINPQEDPITFDYTGITFEGSTVDGNETTLSITDPTADRTITVPNSTGTMVLNTTMSSLVYDSNVTFEGSTDDGNETVLQVTDPTADRTITIPNSDQTIGTATSTANDTIQTKHMADEDHGDVLWSSGVASVQAMDDDPTLDGSISFNSMIVNTAGPTDNVTMDGVNIVWIDTSSANVTIGGGINGTAGQIANFIISDATNNTTIEHEEGANQDFHLSSGSDETISSSYGGWTFGCNGTDWFEIAN